MTSTSKHELENDYFEDGTREGGATHNDISFDVLAVAICPCESFQVFIVASHEERKTVKSNRNDINSKD